MNLTFASNLTKMIDAGLGREAAPPETFVAVGRTTEYTDLGPVPIASFETNVEAPLRALSVAMEPIQAGTGDPSPENVRPITGRQSVKVTRAGKNLFTRTGEVHAYLDSAGNVREYGAGWFLSDYIRVAPSTQYTFNPNTTAGGAAKSWYFDANKNGISYIDSGGCTFTTPDNCAFMRFSYREASTDVQLEMGAIATPYEPYNGQTVTLQLGETVYGGTLDVVRGVLTVTMAMVDMGGLTWNKNVYIDTVFNASGLSDSVKGITNEFSGAICSAYASKQTIGVSELSNNSFMLANNATLYVFRDDRYNAVADFKAAVSGVQLCYKLAEPITIQLTPEQITTLIGQNNVWSDGGDISLTYGTTRYTEGY